MIKPYYTPDIFDPARSIGYLIKQVTKLSTAQCEAMFAGRELTMSQWIALSLIKAQLAGNCAELARQLGHNSGATTRLIDQLEERGLLRRSRAGGDRRVIKVELTPAGETEWGAATPLVLGLWNDALTDFSHDEIDTMVSLTGRLVAALETRARAAGVEA